MRTDLFQGERQPKTPSLTESANTKRGASMAIAVTQAEYRHRAIDSLTRFNLRNRSIMEYLDSLRRSVAQPG